MLPFSPCTFVLAWSVCAVLYALLTKAGILLCALFALCSFSLPEILAGTACTASSMLLCSALFSRAGARGCMAAAAACAAAFALCPGWAPALAICAVQGVISILFLARADPYAFQPAAMPGKCVPGKSRRAGMLRYLLRSFASDSAPILNSAGMWILAAVFPLLFSKDSSETVQLLCIAVLCVHTPAATLLSSEPALGRALHALPDQKVRFLVLYAAFLLAFGAVSAGVFLLSSAFVASPPSPHLAVCTAFLVCAGAFLSAFLEWRFPVRGWRTRSDLWRHPRRYIAPLVLALFALLFGMLPRAVLFAWPFLAVAAYWLFVRNRPHSRRP